MLKELELRRSCRKYSDRPVEEEKINEIIKAGLISPTGKNNQNVEFIVVTNKDKREQLTKLNASVINSDKDTFYGAPVIILVMAKKSAFAELDGGAAILSLLVEATHQGLGSCWINRAKEELEMDSFKELFKDLNINFDEYLGIGHAIIGYSDEEEKAPKEIKENRVYYVK